MFQPLTEAYYFFRKNLGAIGWVLFPLVVPVLLVQHTLSYVIEPFLKEKPTLAMIPAWIELVARPFYTGALVYLLAALIQQKPWDRKQCYTAAARYWLPLFLLSVYCNLVVSIGFLAFVVPGLWLFSRYAFVNFLTVYHQLSFTAAIQKSNELSRPYRAPLMAGSGILLAFIVLFYYVSRAFIETLTENALFLQAAAFGFDLAGFLIIALLDILLFRFFCLATGR